MTEEEELPIGELRGHLRLIYVRGEIRAAAHHALVAARVTVPLVKKALWLDPQQVLSIESALDGDRCVLTIKNQERRKLLVLSGVHETLRALGLIEWRQLPVNP